METPGLKFNFGIPPATTQQHSTGNNVTSSVSFSEQPSITSNTDSDPKLLQRETSQEASFVFGSPQKHEFEFKPKPPRRVSSGPGDEESDGNYSEEEGDIYFKPVIPLPDKVDVVTGEEEETVLYCHRAKLYRFVNGEWKERGLGDIKILRRKDNGKLR